MTINCRVFSFAFLFNLLSPFLVFAADLSLGIRGFSMGDRYAYVFQQEKALGEFSLKDTPDDSRLVYEGRVLGEPASIVYSFRGKRLCSVRYVWILPADKPLFFEGLKSLIARKYTLADSKILTTPGGEALYWLYSGKEEPPSLLAELEFLPADSRSASAPNTAILEFRTPDPDSVLIKRILKEDI